MVQTPRFLSGDTYIVIAVSYVSLSSSPFLNIDESDYLTSHME